MSETEREDKFADLLRVSTEHRAAHGCGAYPYDKGPLLRVLATGMRPARIVEVGTAVGYTAVCMADAAPETHIDTIDFDAEHCRLATQHFVDYGVDKRAVAHCGEADDVLDSFDGNGYDLAFFDGFAPTRSILNGLGRLLRPGGLLICANLTLGGDGEALLTGSDRWLTHSLGETALAIKQ